MPAEPVLQIIEEQIKHERRAPSENIYDGRQYHQTSGALLKEHLFFTLGQILRAIGGGSHRVTNKPIIANLFMENFELKAISTSAHPKSVEKIC